MTKLFELRTALGAVAEVLARAKGLEPADLLPIFGAPDGGRAPIDRERLSTKQAAEYLGLSPRTLSTYRAFGRGPKVRKLGRRNFYDVADLDAYLRRRRRPGWLRRKGRHK